MPGEKDYFQGLLEMDTLTLILITIMLTTLALIGARTLWSRRANMGRTQEAAKRPSSRAGHARGLDQFPGGEKAKFAGVSIETGATPRPCEAALAMAGDVFPSEDAPLLPLPECTGRDACQCHYESSGERRDGERRLPNSLAPSYLAHKGMKDRRTPKEKRRKSDRSAAL